MKINTFSQNKLSFGVRKPFDTKITIETLQQRIRPYVVPPNTTRAHYLLFEKIMRTKGNQSLRSFFNNIKNSYISEGLKEGLEKSKVKLKRIFWETCDRFFDVQLTKPGDQLRDDERHIPDDDELKAIFPKERTSHLDSMENAKKLIDYYCDFEAKQKNEKLNKGKMFDSFLEASSHEVSKNTLWHYKTAINRIKAHLDKIGRFKTDEEFQEYIVNECNGKKYTICRNQTLFSYAVDKLKELKQKEAEMKDALKPQKTGQTATAQKAITPRPQEIVQPLQGVYMVPQGVNYYPTNQPPLYYVGQSPLHYVRPNFETNDSQQNIQTETNATKQRANIKRPHESYDDAYSDKRRKM